MKRLLFFVLLLALLISSVSMAQAKQYYVVALYGYDDPTAQIVVNKFREAITQDSAFLLIKYSEVSEGDFIIQVNAKIYGNQLVYSYVIVQVCDVYTKALVANMIGIGKPDGSDLDFLNEMKYLEDFLRK